MRRRISFLIMAAGLLAALSLFGATSALTEVRAHRTSELVVARDDARGAVRLEGFDAEEYTLSSEFQPVGIITNGLAFPVDITLGITAEGERASLRGPVEPGEPEEPGEPGKPDKPGKPEQGQKSEKPGKDRNGDEDRPWELVFCLVKARDLAEVAGSTACGTRRGRSGEVIFEGMGAVPPRTQWTRSLPLAPGQSLYLLARYEASPPFAQPDFQGQASFRIEATREEGFMASLSDTDATPRRHYYTR